MALLVTMGATLQCSFGEAPAPLVVLPANKVLTSVPAANILDNKPLVNITPFGLCKSPKNPLVAAATAKALGVLTPMPCTPNTPAPWGPGCPKVLIGGQPALNSTSQCLCAFGGVISIVSPANFQVMSP